MPIVTVLLLQIVLPTVLAAFAAWLAVRRDAAASDEAASWITVEAERGIQELEAHLRRINRRRSNG